jgi:hypothetical protein
MNDQQRRHQRHLLEASTFIELVSPAMISAEPGKLSACKTQKVSQSGLQLSLKEQVTPGLILQIGVHLPSVAETLYLAGEVKWCNINADTKMPWVAGFELLNDKESDINRWVEIMIAMDAQARLSHCVPQRYNAVDPH